MIRKVPTVLSSFVFLVFVFFSPLYLSLLCEIFSCATRYVGRLMVKSSSKPMDITGKLNEMAGFAPDEDLELFEV